MIYVAITAGSKHGLIENLSMWNEALTVNGMKMNKSKIKQRKYLEERKEIQIRLDDQLVEQVSSSHYLECIQNRKKNR